MTHHPGERIWLPTHPEHKKSSAVWPPWTQRGHCIAPIAAWLASIAIAITYTAHSHLSCTSNHSVAITYGRQRRSAVSKWFQHSIPGVVPPCPSPTALPCSGQARRQPIRWPTAHAARPRCASTLYNTNFQRMRHKPASKTLLLWDINSEKEHITSTTLPCPSFLWIHGEHF